jgi:hypothetical protein
VYRSYSFHYFLIGLIEYDIYLGLFFCYAIFHSWLDINKHFYVLFLYDNFINKISGCLHVGLMAREFDELVLDGHNYPT